MRGRSRLMSSRRVQIVPDPDQRYWVVLHCLQCEGSQLVPMAQHAEIICQAAARHGHVTEQLVVECFVKCRSCTQEMSLTKAGTN